MKELLAKLCMVTICLLESENTIKITFVFCVNNCTSVDSKQCYRILNKSYLRISNVFFFAVLTGKGNELKSPEHW